MRVSVHFMTSSHAQTRMNSYRSLCGSTKGSELSQVQSWATEHHACRSLASHPYYTQLLWAHCSAVHCNSPSTVASRRRARGAREQCSGGWQHHTQQNKRHIWTDYLVSPGYAKSHPVQIWLTESSQFMWQGDEVIFPIGCNLGGKNALYWCGFLGLASLVQRTNKLLAYSPTSLLSM